MELPKELKDEIWEYCRINDITDLNAFMVKMLRQGYTTEKYGPTPFKMGGETEKIVEKEIVVEKLVEVPIEVIKEIPVEIIVEKEVIKEIPVEKIVKVSDDTQINELLSKIEKLENKPAEIIEVIKEVPIEVIKEVEKIVEVNVYDNQKVKQLEQQVENLKIELELEKNRNYQPPKPEKPKEDKPKNMLGSVISWVSKNERDDLYNE